MNIPWIRWMVAVAALAAGGCCTHVKTTESGSKTVVSEVPIVTPDPPPPKP